MQKLNLHITSLPHTRVSKEFNACAYTSKVYNMCQMMMSLGHNVTLYAPEGSTAPCTKLVQTISTKEQEELCGIYDWKKEMFKIVWDANLPYWKITNLRAAAEINMSAKKGDIVLISGGNCQKPLSDLLDHNQVAVSEWCIGYQGIFLPKFKIYESYTHQARVETMLNHDPNGNNYNAVVPCYFDPSNFTLGDGKGDEKGEYYLYLGRLIRRKGILVAEQVCKHLNKRLVIAGQGVKEWDPDKKRLVTEENEVFEGEHIDYVGYADVEKRNKLMGGAIAQFVCTQYFGPGENVQIEANATGTPVICSDWGCFTQQCPNGICGYRPYTFEETIWAANAVRNLDRQIIYNYAHEHFSMEKVKYLFQQVFERFYNLYMKNGWYTLNPDRSEYLYFN